jgi:predicted DNA-binding protein (MmcQ/YjbR family)
MPTCSPPRPSAATTPIEMIVSSQGLAYDLVVAHPQMFDDDDRFLEQVRRLAAALPSTDEKVSHGRPAFFTKKVFAYYGGSLKVDDEWVQHPHSIVVQPDESDRRALLEDQRTFVPAYLGPSGWVGLDLDDDTDWTEVAELLDASYRLAAPARDVAELDARG